MMRGFSAEFFWNLFLNSGHGKKGKSLFLLPPKEIPA